MPSISPINQLNTYAKKMLTSIVKESPDKTQAVKTFFKHANENNLQGPAIIAYHTNFNNLKDIAHKQNFEIYSRIKCLPELVEKEITDNPEVEKEGKLFFDKLVSLYPNSIENRVSLASQGAVTADKVEPKSRIKKFFVLINRMLKEDI